MKVESKKIHLLVETPPALRGEKKVMLRDLTVGQAQCWALKQLLYSSNQPREKTISHLHFTEKQWLAQGCVASTSSSNKCRFHTPRLDAVLVGWWGRAHYRGCPQATSLSLPAVLPCSTLFQPFAYKTGKLQLSRL